MYAGIFIVDYAENMALKEQHSGISMSSMELLRAMCSKFCGILQSMVIPRLKLWHQILIILIKPKKEVKMVSVTIPGDVWVNEREVGKTEK